MMLMRNKMLIVGVILSLGLLLTGFGTKVSAQFSGSTTAACGALQGDENQDCTSGGETTVNRLLKTAINIFSLVVGVTALIMIILGGLKFVTSRGDPNNISAARNTIIYALVGLLIVAMSQFIVRFVLTKANPPKGDPAVNQCVAEGNNPLGCAGNNN